MNNYENDFYGRQTWTFHIQSVEDFHKQLREFADTNYTEIEVEDTQLAEEMLQAIGIKTK